GARDDGDPIARVSVRMRSLDGHARKVQLQVNLKSMALPSLITIGELASRTGVATSALRFYEQRGLIRSERTQGNQRRFARATVRRVSVIRAAQRCGISLEEIGAVLARLPDDRTPTARDWQELST